MEILDHEEKRLHLALPKQQALDRIQGLLSALGWVESLPRRIRIARGGEEVQERRQRRLEGSVKGQRLPRHLLADLAAPISVVHAEVRLE